MKEIKLGPKEQIHKSIVEACKKGKDKARYELYQLYSKAMFNVCYRIMNNREEAEDMLQEAFTQAFMKIESFRWESSFGTWLKRIVVNTCLNAINKKKVELTYCEEIYHYDKPEEEEETEVQFTVANITRAMELLPEGGRMVFSLYLLEGYDHTEIAQIMRITESTSKSQFMRAKRRIIEILKEQKSRGL
ncbi:RNA polymerase sigma factor [Maribellus comscasis]|uniref:RNA polymerase sigma factor n=1 Tax=Maribellus comscasis TaxID=2681766 RepID=UPI001C2CCB5B|nr:sigma-70 family RNA polymerase sigma factor [Maribellus comscasis]